jgi:urea transport system substrate-binding protein
MYRSTRALVLLATSAVACASMTACTNSSGRSNSSAQSPSSEGTAKTGTIPIGLIDDSTGTSSIFGPPTTAVAKLAVTQINANGGINGKKVSLLVEDGGTSPTTSKAAAQRLISQDHVVALFATFSTAQSQAVEPVAGATSVPYFYTPVWEGGVCKANLFSQGEVPAQQLAPTIPWVQQQTKRKTWYLLGDDYAWPHDTFALAKKYIAGAGGKVVGEDYVPLGTTDYSSVISKIQSSGADVMIPALVGGDAIAFEKQAYDAGLTNSKVQRLAVLYEDNTRTAMGPDVTQGMYFSTNYDQSMGNVTNTQFIDAYRKMFGQKAAPVTTLSEHAYLAMKAWAQASGAAKSTNLKPLSQALSGLKVDSPGGKVTFEANHYVSQSISVVQIQKDGTAKVVTSFDAVDPSQDCSF